MTDKPASFDFGALIAAIRQVDENLAYQAGRAVNISLTLRNWVIGCHIREYEQNGADRAEYGRNLFQKLSQELKKIASIEYHPRELRRCREFYTAYPQIRGTLSPKFDNIISPDIGGLLTPESGTAEALPMRGTVSPELEMPPHRHTSPNFQGRKRFNASWRRRCERWAMSSFKHFLIGEGLRMLIWVPFSPSVSIPLHIDAVPGYW